MPRPLLSNFLSLIDDGALPFKMTHPTLNFALDRIPIPEHQLDPIATRFDNVYFAEIKISINTEIIALGINRSSV